MIVLTLLALINWPFDQLYNNFAITKPPLAAAEYTISVPIKGKLIVIHPASGKVDVPEGIAPDEASRAFFDALRKGYAPCAEPRP